MSDHVIKLCLYVWLASGTLIYILLIGQPRKPIAPIDCVINICVAFLVAWAVYSL